MNELRPTDYDWRWLEGLNLLTVTWFQGKQVAQEVDDVQALDESDDEAMEYEADEKENGSDTENW